MIPINADTRLLNIKNVIEENCPSFSGIVAQECKGYLWVDDIEAPTLAIAESYAVGNFAFLGTTQSKAALDRLRTFLDNELFVQLQKDGHTGFEFSIENENLRKDILELFQDKTIHTDQEHSFRIKTLPIVRQEIPKDYRIVKVDTEFWRLLSENRFDNAEFLTDRLLESWYTFEEFQNKSTAYCTLLDNRIVAVIVGTSHYKNVIPIDIETEEAHRRKGLAFAMSAAFIGDCLKSNYIPQWDCVETNQASYHMACKLGFKKLRENTVYWFDFD